MTRTLLSVFACSALLLAAPGQAPDAASLSPVDVDARAFAAVHGDAGEVGPIVLSAQALEQTTGAGATSEFVCSAMSGASLVLAVTGVGAGAGIALGIGGVVCSLFF